MTLHEPATPSTEQHKHRFQPTSTAPLRRTSTAFTSKSITWSASQSSHTMDTSDPEGLSDGDVSSGPMTPVRTPSSRSDGSPSPPWDRSSRRWSPSYSRYCPPVPTAWPHYDDGSRTVIEGPFWPYNLYYEDCPWDWCLAFFRHRDRCPSAESTPRPSPSSSPEPGEHSESLPRDSSSHRWSPTYEHYRPPWPSAWPTYDDGARVPFYGPFWPSSGPNHSKSERGSQSDTDEEPSSSSGTQQPGLPNDGEASHDRSMPAGSLVPFYLPPVPTLWTRPRADISASLGPFLNGIPPPPPNGAFLGRRAGPKLYSWPFAPAQAWRPRRGRLSLRVVTAWGYMLRLQRSQFPNVPTAAPRSLETQLNEVAAALRDMYQDLNRDSLLETQAHVNARQWYTAATVFASRAAYFLTIVVPSHAQRLRHHVQHSLNILWHRIEIICMCLHSSMRAPLLLDAEGRAPAFDQATYKEELCHEMEDLDRQIQDFEDDLPPQPQPSSSEGPIGNDWVTRLRAWAAQSRTALTDFQTGVRSIPDDVIPRIARVYYVFYLLEVDTLFEQLHHARHRLWTERWPIQEYTYAYLSGPGRTRASVRIERYSGRLRDLDQEARDRIIPGLPRGVALNDFFEPDTRQSLVPRALRPRTQNARGSLWFQYLWALWLIWRSLTGSKHHR